MYFLLLILVSTVWSVSGQTSAPLTVVRTWTGGCMGTFTIHADNAVHGWTCTLNFAPPIDKLDIWKATVSSSSGSQFTVTNMPFDKDLTSGQDLLVEFNGHISGDKGCSGTYTCTGVSTVAGGTSSSGSGTPSPGGGSSSSGSGTGTSGGTSTGSSSGGSATAAPSSGGVAVSHQCSGCGSAMKYNYKEALKLSILFFDAQRSGYLPANNPIPWRGDSNVHDADDGHDLSGGWYDAGDHVKFNLPMAWSATVLLWGMLEFREGYNSAGQTDMACDMIRTPLDYFLKCWIPDQQRNYVQVGDGHQDHAYWGRPETMSQWRVGWRTDSGCHGSDIAGEMVAAMASGSMVFNDMCHDTNYAGKLLEAAKGLYKFAKANRGKYSDCVTVAKDFYGSNSEVDDMAVAASWMYRATSDTSYLSDAKGFYHGGTPWTFNWDDSNVEAALLLYQITGDDAYKGDVEALVRSFMPGGDVAQTPCGLAWRDKWGPNRHAGNMAFIATMAAKFGIKPDEYKKWAMSQVNYLLGDNKLHISYEIGFGSYYPKRPHHRGSSCATNGWCAKGGADNPNVLLGGLVGGPDQGDNYNDDRNDFVSNEVACDYNAGFQSALAGLSYYASVSELPPSPAAKC
ncbi:endoglucanase E-4-like [Mercenaria mercenaria]|uniref:endoglucanase E-4-like n=1 Tax=Mercenaria mercenaria TaxID=6596 RepID=UPI00234F751D|nr:endoglucanase E-4-like [Mercenaria mercenaria]